MADRYLSPNGSDANTGTLQSPWRTFAQACPRLQPDDTLNLLAGIHRGTFRASGTAQAPITLNALVPEAVIDGGVTAGSWTKDAAGTWSIPWYQAAFGAWQGTYESLGKNAALFWRDYNQYDSNPTLDIDPNDPAPQFKLKNLRLYVRTTGGVNPADVGLVVAVTELAVDLNDCSHVIVKNVTTRHHKSAVGTRNGAGIHLVGCNFGMTGVTGVWLVKLTDSDMVGCRLQGAGSWAGHYEDLCQVDGCSPRIADCDLSYGGHCGILCLGPGSPVIDGNKFHDMGGTLLLLKKEINGAKVRNNQFRGAAWVRDLTVHRVPHAAIQLSGDDNVIENNLFEQNGVHILASSTNVQSCRRNLIQRNTMQDSEGAALDIQETETAGGTEGNVVRANIIRRGDQGKWVDGSPQTRLVFFAFANRHGLGVNVVEDNLIDISGTVNLNGAVLSSTNDATRTENRGYTAPTNGGGGGGGGGDPMPTKPTLTALTPSTAKPGDIVTADGALLGVGPLLVVMTRKPTEAAPTAKRIPWTSADDKRIVFKIPDGSDARIGVCVSGPVYARNTQLNLPTNLLQLTVGVPPPPVNKPPVANAGGPYTGIAGVSIQFDGSKSSDPDGTIALYSWDFSDITGVAGAVPKPFHTFVTAGIYKVTLTVTDDKGVTATVTTTATITAAPPPAELKVTVSALAIASGAIASANVTNGASTETATPLPVGSTITVTARTPDGRTAAGTATIAGAPPPVDENHLEDVFEFMGASAEQALLKSGLWDHFPWGSLKPGLQRVGLQKIRCEFADLSWAGAALTTMDGEILHQNTLTPTVDGETLTHVVWGGMLPGVGEGEMARSVVGLAWSSGLLQIEKTIKNDAAFVKLVTGYEGSHMADFFLLALDGDGLGSHHARLLELAFAPAPMTGKWWAGSYPSSAYFNSVGEAWMAGMGIAYGDGIPEDRRFSPFFKLGDAAAIRAIVGLARTDGKT